MIERGEVDGVERRPLGELATIALAEQASRHAMEREQLAQLIAKAEGIDHTEGWHLVQLSLRGDAWEWRRGE